MWAWKQQPGALESLVQPFVYGCIPPAPSNLMACPVQTWDFSGAEWGRRPQIVFYSIRGAFLEDPLCAVCRQPWEYKLEVILLDLFCLRCGRALACVCFIALSLVALSKGLCRGRCWGTKLSMSHSHKACLQISIGITVVDASAKRSSN